MAVLCDECRKPIKYREDLVIASGKYHNKCYSSRKKTVGGFFFTFDRPVNTNSFLYMIILGGILVILFLLFALIPINPSFELLTYPAISLVVIFIIFGVISRIMGYRYERSLPSRKK